MDAPGRNLRAIREACGVTMGELADALGWSTPRLSDLERGLWWRDDAALAFVAALGRIVRERMPAVVIRAVVK